MERVCIFLLGNTAYWRGRAEAAIRRHAAAVCDKFGIELHITGVAYAPADGQEDDGAAIARTPDDVRNAVAVLLEPRNSGNGSDPFAMMWEHALRDSAVLGRHVYQEIPKNWHNTTTGTKVAGEPEIST